MVRERLPASAGPRHLEMAPEYGATIGFFPY